MLPDTDYAAQDHDYADADGDDADAPSNAPLLLAQAILGMIRIMRTDVDIIPLLPHLIWTKIYSSLRCTLCDENSCVGDYFNCPFSFSTHCLPCLDTIREAVDDHTRPSLLSASLYVEGGSGQNTMS